MDVEPLKRCVCGAEVDQDECPYPSGRRTSADGRAMYVVNCTNNECGWQCLGWGADGARKAWNNRHGAGDADRSAELTTAWMAGAESVRERTAGDAEDAARYRWLRDQNTILDNPGAWTITRCDFTDEEGPSRYWVGSDLDSAIDAVRAVERGYTTAQRLADEAEFAPGVAPSIKPESR